MTWTELHSRPGYSHGPAGAWKLGLDGFTYDADSVTPVTQYVLRQDSRWPCFTGKFIRGYKVI